MKRAFFPPDWFKCAVEKFYYFQPLVLPGEEKSERDGIWPAGSLLAVIVKISGMNATRRHQDKDQMNQPARACGISGANQPGKD